MDIGDWLRNLGLPQYEAAFREHAIEIDVLSELSEGDLKALGLPLGHRKRLLKAISVLGAIEQKPSEAESELRRMIDHIPVLVAAYRADGSRLSVNQQVAPIAMHPDDVASADGTWGACVASGEPFELEIRLRMADGPYRWHLNRRVPLRDENGKIIRWYGVGYDIEDRKRVEEKLRRSEAFLAKAQRLSLTGSFSFNSATGEFM